MAAEVEDVTGGPTPSADAAALLRRCAIRPSSKDCANNFHFRVYLNFTTLFAVHVEMQILLKFG